MDHLFVPATQIENTEFSKVLVQFLFKITALTCQGFPQSQSQNSVTAGELLVLSLIDNVGFFARIRDYVAILILISVFSTFSACLAC